MCVGILLGVLIRLWGGVDAILIGVEGTSGCVEGTSGGVEGTPGGC